MYRILALDGGGIRGLLTLALLARLEEEVPGWTDKIDLVAGTSTGAIIAIGIAAGASYRELLQHYLMVTDEIFGSRHPGVRVNLKTIFRPKYDTAELRSYLKSLLGNKTLGELRKKIVITTFNLDNKHPDPAQRCWEPQFFHNLNCQDGEVDLEAYQAVLYSCATPVYFPAVNGYIDGAVTAQNPSLVALSLALSEMKVEDRESTIEEIALFSASCGKYGRYLHGNKHNWGFSQWTRLLVDMMLEGSVDLAHRTCQLLLGENYHRLSPLLPELIHADDWTSQDVLLALAQDAELDSSVAWLSQRWGGR